MTEVIRAWVHTQATKGEFNTFNTLNSQFGKNVVITTMHCGTKHLVTAESKAYEQPLNEYIQAMGKENITEGWLYRPEDSSCNLLNDVTRELKGNVNTEAIGHNMFLITSKNPEGVRALDEYIMKLPT